MSARKRYLGLGTLFISLSCYLYFFYDSATLLAEDLFIHRWLSGTHPQPVLKNILVVGVRWDLGLGDNNQRFIDSCPLASSCFITKDQKYMQNTTFDAFVIHAPVIKQPWPVHNRTTNQIVVFFSLEPPDHVPKQSDFGDFYNWTMSYRADSDIVLPYGSIKALREAPGTEDRLLELIAQSSNQTQVAAGKTKLAAWMVSNCKASSNRHLYVQQLEKYVQVDIFGRKGCFNSSNSCPRTQDCWSRVEKEYKFYLSFENSICDDYVTEKFFDMMERNIVPIVLGGANYSALAPPHSYINALDFKPKELAEYLRRLDANDSLYAQYFWWKPYYSVQSFRHTSPEAFCKLCTALHETPLNRKTVASTHQWFIKRANCVYHSKF